MNIEHSKKDTYLSFSIANELYAVMVGKVLEVLQTQSISSVPNAPEYIQGVMNFRGEIIPVFKTRTKFCLPKRDDNQKYVIIVLEVEQDGEKVILGAIADNVKDVITITDKDIKPIPQIQGDLKADFLQGIAKIDDQFILLLDVDENVDIVQINEQLSSRQDI